MRFWGGGKAALAVLPEPPALGLPAFGWFCCGLQVEGGGDRGRVSRCRLIIGSLLVPFSGHLCAGSSIMRPDLRTVDRVKWMLSLGI
jgi:hypothetical protein